MGLLVKCNITNSIIPENENNEVVVSVLVKNPSNNINMKTTIKSVVAGTEFKIDRTYHDLPFCMRDYTHTGIIFKGTISGYSGPQVDFDDPENLRALRLLVTCTQFDVHDDYNNLYDINKINEFMAEDNYDSAWEIIQESFRHYDEDRIYMAAPYEDQPQPICLSVISKHVYDEFMSPQFMKEVFDTFYYNSKHIETLEDRISLAPKILEKLKENLRKHFSLSEQVFRLESDGHYLLDNDLYCFSRINKRYFSKYVYGNLLWSGQLNETQLIDIIEDYIKLDYFVCCVEYVQAEFNRVNVCSIEDYQNSYTAKRLKLSQKVFRKLDQEFASFDGYNCFIDSVMPVKDTVFYATYLHDGDLEGLSKIAGIEIDVNQYSECDSNTIIVYDSIQKKIFSAIDYEFVEKYDIEVV